MLKDVLFLVFVSHCFASFTLHSIFLISLFFSLWIIGLKWISSFSNSFFLFTSYKFDTKWWWKLLSYFFFSYFSNLLLLLFMPYRLLLCYVCSLIIWHWIFWILCCDFVLFFIFLCWIFVLFQFYSTVSFFPLPIISQIIHNIYS